MLSSSATSGAVWLSIVVRQNACQVDGSKSGLDHAQRAVDEVLLSDRFWWAGFRLEDIGKLRKRLLSIGPASGLRVAGAASIMHANLVAGGSSITIRETCLRPHLV